MVVLSSGGRRPKSLLLFLWASVLVHGWLLADAFTQPLGKLVAGLVGRRGACGLVDDSSARRWAKTRQGRGGVREGEGLGLGMTRMMAYKWSGAPDTRSTREMLHPGISPAGYLDERHSRIPLTAEATEQLFSRGYVVLDGVLDEAEAESLSYSMDYVDDLMIDPDYWKGVRDDAVQFVDEDAEWLPEPLASTIRLVKGVGDMLHQPYIEAMRGDYADKWRIRDGQPLEPATAERPLTVVPEAQLASFGPGGQYVIHSDNPLDENGARRNHRCFTVICYAQAADWSDEDKGHLRIWVGTDNICPSECQEEGVSTAEVLHKKLREGRRPELPDEDSSYFVDILPKAGRMVIFRSTLLHQVCPSLSRRRRAITVWVYSPQEGFVPT
jgi:hypothetical protein